MRIYFYLLLFATLSPAFVLGNIHLTPLPTDSSSSLFNRMAASKYISEGEKLLEQGRTLDALRRFREAYNRDNYSSKATYWIAEAHYALDNFGLALNYGKIAEKLSDGKEGDISFIIAKSYHRMGELDSAKIYFDLTDQQLSKSKKKAYDFSMHFAEIKYALTLTGTETRFEKRLLNDYINSGYDDYNAVLTNDGKGLYYVSRRPDTKGGNINPHDQRYFEDIYYSEWEDETKSWGEPSNQLGRLNSEGFDALNYLSADGKTAYLTVNTYILDIPNPTESSDICIAEKAEDGTWRNPRPISNNSINTPFFDGAATLTADENTMYFVSDRNGERSKSDIFVVQKEGRNWGTAQRLPDIINSKENETTPFITPDGKFLFFSSKGHESMGGYDVYVSENLGNNNWSVPVNLGIDFNTVNDDIFFKYYPQEKKAYVSTHRIQGDKSSIDIFELLLDDWKIPSQK